MKISLFYLPTYLPEIHGSEERLYQDIYLASGPTQAVATG